MNQLKYKINVLCLIAFVAFSILTTVSSEAAVSPEETAPSASASAPGSAKKKKSTEVNFDDVLVNGKYHFSDEAVTTVEGDKVLDALLGVRTDFKDRLKKSASRH